MKLRGGMGSKPRSLRGELVLNRQFFAVAAWLVALDQRGPACCKQRSTCEVQGKCWSYGASCSKPLPAESNQPWTARQYSVARLSCPHWPTPSANSSRIVRMNKQVDMYSVERERRQLLIGNRHLHLAPELETLNCHQSPSAFSIYLKPPISESFPTWAATPIRRMPAREKSKLFLISPHAK